MSKDFGPDPNSLPYGLAHLPDPEIKDIYDDFAFKQNAVTRGVSDQNIYFNNNPDSETKDDRFKNMLPYGDFYMKQQSQYLDEVE